MEHTVNAAKCMKCGKITYPTHFYCPACGSTDFGAVAVEGEGTLLTFTRAYTLPLDYEDLYLTLGIVEMDQGIRATGQLDIDEPATGIRVLASVGPVRDVDGRTVYGLKFRAV
ncbi:MAG: hypothetical protein WCK47_13195 [bacterium]|nr:hypothetical protein [Candidatus Sumerlaeota bacterium]